MKDKKVLLTLLPVFWPKLPPLGICFLKEYLLMNNIQADILDANNLFYRISFPELKKEWLKSCNIRFEKNILSILEKHCSDEFNRIIKTIADYDFAGFSCFKSNIPLTLEIAKRVKKRNPSIKIILGGPEMARLYFKTLGSFNIMIKDISDFIIVGEGEKPLLDFINRKTNGNNFAAFSELDTLKYLPFPSYNRKYLEDYPQMNSVPLLFSRGCVKKCNFCSERLLYKKFRIRPVENLLDEIAFNRSCNSINHFIFFDSLINADLQKLEVLCDGIISLFGSIKWEAQVYIRDDMDYDLLNKMKKSGCTHLFVGLESGSDTVLKRMNKGFTCAEAKNFFMKLKNAGLSFGISLIVGYPGETQTEFQESLDFIINNRQLISKIEQVNPFTYYDGTNTDENADYKINNESLERMEIFVSEIKKHRFKYTNAFIGNLIEK